MIMMMTMMMKNVKNGDDDEDMKEMKKEMERDHQLDVSVPRRAMHCGKYTSSSIRM